LWLGRRVGRVVGRAVEGTQTQSKRQSNLKERLVFVWLSPWPLLVQTMGTTPHAEHYDHVGLGLVATKTRPKEAKTVLVVE